MKKLLALLAIVIVFGGSIFASYNVGKMDAPAPEVKTVIQTVEKEVEVEKKINVSTEFVEDKLSDIGELATLDVQYMGVVKVEDEEGVSFINKVGYSMLYTIEVKIGIQFDDIKVDVTDSEVTVTLPEPEVLSRHADGGTLQFFDKKWALFKSNDVSDVPIAISLAEEDFDKQNEKIDTYLDLAGERAELAVRKLLEGVIGDKKLVIQ